VRGAWTRISIAAVGPDTPVLTPSSAIPPPKSSALLIPPAASRATLWRHQVPAFVEAGYPVFVYDLRETLPSGEPARIFNLADLVTDAAELITALGIGPSRVLGASLGALIAQELTLTKPSLVMAVALIGPRGRTDAFRAALARGYAQASA
jgi:pimeloyl-ACP methyl ester carboxylesterase